MFTRKKLYKVLGEYFAYPECCVSNFIEGNTEYFTEKHIAYGSGFVPCRCCYDKTLHMNREQISEWLGRSPWSKRLPYIDGHKNSLFRSFEKKFIQLSQKHKLEIDEYRKHKINHIQLYEPSFECEY